MKHITLLLIYCCMLFSTNLLAMTNEEEILILEQLITSNETDEEMIELNVEINEINEDMTEMSHELKQLVKTLRSMGDHKVGNKPFLGILMDDEHRGDSRGVVLIGVTPDGPAKRAGLQAGDVILSINEQSMEKDDQQQPNSKLYYAMKKIKPGEEMTLIIDRKGKQKQVKLIAAKKSDHLRFGLNYLADDLEKRLHNKNHLMTQHGTFSGIELYPLNKDLGRYFGSDSGMLILKVPAENKLNLAAGDVILKIGDRVPNSPFQTWRILQSYDSGETINFSLMRQRKEVMVPVIKP